MKKLTITIALTALLTLSAFANPVDVKTAQKVATTFLNNNGAKTAQLTDLSKAAGFPNLYIFSTESSFVIISRDDCAKPILGYSLSDKFSVEDMPENLRWWLQGYSDEIQWGIENNIQPDKTTATEWQDLKEGKASKDIPTAVVEPLLSTKWDQGSPYNDSCPKIGTTRTITGCVATAMAQIMKYWEYPSHGIGSHSYTWNGQTLDADFGATNYDWSNMTNIYNNSSTTEQKQAVATLMYHCGVSVNMNYGTSASGAAAFNVAAALKTYFNYNPEISYEVRSEYSDEDWIALLKTELDSLRPVQYSGSTESNHGHSFVCDGYNSDNYFHFNWGWGGRQDDYFLIDNLNTSLGDYNFGHIIIIGVEPVRCNAEDPSNLVYSQNGRNISLNWSTASGAASYNIYRNGGLIGSSQTNSYTDANAPFGINSYYIRSVDSEGNLSFASNSVTVTVEYNIEGLVAEGLSLDYNNGEMLLQWASPARLQYIDYHSFEGIVYYTGGFQKWATRFTSSYLTTYSGMKVTSIASYFYTAGQYTTKLYQCNGNTPLGEAIVTITDNYSKGWQTIELGSSNQFTLDNSKDLWIVFECSGIEKPTLIGAQSTSEGDYYYLESKNEWRHFTGYTFFVSANLSDGNYTYNLYRNDTKIGDNLSNNTFLDANPVDNSANLYVVKINNSESESNPSNMVGITIGTALLNGDLTIGNYDMMTLVEESSLTVTGTIINTDEDNLILENGAQLIHSSEGVKATVKKSIAPINGNQGWNFIASPVTENIEPSKGNGLLNGSLEDNTYDLYYYEEPSHYWRNYETHSQDFTIEHKKGYLYANGEENGTTLQFSGTLIPSNNNMTISDLSHDDATLNGFNLVGNPFTCNATVNTDYYVIDASNNSVVLAETGRLISPCEGIFVKASETNNYQVTFSKPTRGNVVSNHIDFVISQDRSTLDRARVRFGKGTGMEKFSLSDNDSRLYIPQNGQDFAVAYASEQKEMPVNFKAMQDGIYTLTLEKESLELDYLHLVDNMTGSNIDLLTTPSYTFEATTRDYASRFRLLFTPENDASTGSASENIGFMVNGKFQLTEGEGVIQVIDASGRTLRSKNDSKEIDLSGLSAGVYVLRLISANNVKTQKIVIE